MKSDKFCQYNFLPKIESRILAFSFVYLISDQSLLDTFQSTLSDSKYACCLNWMADELKGVIHKPREQLRGKVG